MVGIAGRGWELLVKRIREEQRGGKRRTVGTYQLFIEGVLVDGISGFSCESKGPGDNSAPNGRRVEAGSYPISTQFGEKYRTIGYNRGSNRRELPKPGIELNATAGRTEILIHPGQGFLSSVGCINPAQALAGASDDIDFFLSHASVVSLIETLKGFLGDRFPREDGRPIPDAFVVIEGEPAFDGDTVVDRITALESAADPGEVTISTAQIASLFPRPGSGGARDNYDAYIATFGSERGLATLRKYGITGNAMRMAHFFAQAAHETGGFKLMRESLTYTTVAAIRKAWETRAAPHSDQWITDNLLRKPVALGDWAYGGRMGNRKGTSDGFDFRGGGVFQTTGRKSFAAKGRIAKVDLELHPELIDDPQVSLITACAEWDDLGCNALADADNGTKISRGINRGSVNSASAANGETERLDFARKLRAVLEG